MKQKTLLLSAIISLSVFVVNALDHPGITLTTQRSDAFPLIVNSSPTAIYISDNDER